MSYSALILAGGMGSRLGYREKALIDINGRPLIELIIERLKIVVDSIIISVRDRAQGELLGATLSRDISSHTTITGTWARSPGSFPGFLNAKTNIVLFRRAICLLSMPMLSTCCLRKARIMMQPSRAGMTDFLNPCMRFTGVRL